MGFDEEIDPTLVGDPAIFGKSFKNKECELLIKLEKTGTNKIIDEVLEKKGIFQHSQHYIYCQSFLIIFIARRIIPTECV